MVNGKNGWQVRCFGILVAATVIAVVSIAFRPLIAARADIDTHLQAKDPHPVLAVQLERIAGELERIRTYMETHP